MNRTQIATATLSLLVGFGLTPTADAAGNFGYRPNPGNYCQASSGPGAQVFYFGPDYVENTSNSLQYINCGAAQILDYGQAVSTDGTTGVETNAHFFNPTSAAASVTCVGILTANNSSFSASLYRKQVVKTLPLAANSGNTVYIAANELSIDASVGTRFTIALNCSMPAGTRLTGLGFYQPKNF